jgi:hypothetical protein
MHAGALRCHDGDVRDGRPRTQPFIFNFHTVRRYPSGQACLFDLAVVDDERERVSDVAERVEKDGRLYAQLFRPCAPHCTACSSARLWLLLRDDEDEAPHEVDLPPSVREVREPESGLQRDVEEQRVLLKLLWVG